MTTPPITSTQNPRIRQALRLRDRRGRKQQKRIIVDGLREIQRASAAHVKPLELFVCESLLNAHDRELVQECSCVWELQPTHVSETVFRKLAFGQRSEGAVLIAEPPSPSLGDIVVADQAFVAVVEAIEKPGNLGAILRSADAAGVAAVIIADPRTELYNPNTIRASLGAVFTLSVCTAGADQVIAWLQEHAFAVYAARVDGAVDYTTVDYRQRCAVVLGSEAEGLSSDWNGPWLTAIQIPMRGVVDSLNVSATAAILFYEALRQQSGGGDASRVSFDA